MAHKWARWLHNPYRLGIPTASERGAESESAHKWARWLPSNLVKNILFFTRKKNLFLLCSQYLVKSSEPSKLLPSKTKSQLKGPRNKANWLPHPYLLRGSQVVRNAI